MAVFHNIHTKLWDPGALPSFWVTKYIQAIYSDYVLRLSLGMLCSYGTEVSYGRERGIGIAFQQIHTASLVWSTLTPWFRHNVCVYTSKYACKYLFDTENSWHRTAHIHTIKLLNLLNKLVHYGCQWSLACSNHESCPGIVWENGSCHGLKPYCNLFQ